MDKLFLTADQIYALAHIQKAKYLDYYYISLASKNVDGLWLSENTKKLVSQGILTEDFSGETTIEPDVESLIKPLFFSTKESSLDIDIFAGSEDFIGYRFHFGEDKIVMSKTVEDGFEITEISLEDIERIVSKILPANYSAVSEKVDIELKPDNVSRVFVVKNTEVEAKSEVATFVETDGVVYEENEEDEIFSLSGTDFANKVYRILTEV